MFSSAYQKQIKMQLLKTASARYRLAIHPRRSPVETPSAARSLEGKTLSVSTSTRNAVSAYTETLTRT